MNTEWSSSDTPESSVDSAAVSDLRNFLDGWTSCSNWLDPEEEQGEPARAQSSSTHFEMMKDRISMILNTPRRQRRQKMPTIREFSFPLAEGCDDLWFGFDQTDHIIC